MEGSINVKSNGIKGVKIVALPYKTFKERIRLTKQYEKKYKIEDLGGVLYMERKEKHL